MKDSEGISGDSLVIARAIASNTLWGTAGRILGGFFAILTVTLTTRALGPERYGGYATILSFFYLFNALADAGLYNILVRDISRPGVNVSRLVGIAYSLRTLTLLGSFLFGSVLFFMIRKYDELENLAAAAIFSYVALSFAQLTMAVLQKHFAMARAAIAEALSRAAQLVGVAFLWVTHTQDLGAYLGILAGASILQFLFLFRAARRFVPIRFSATRTELLRMLREAAPVAISLLFTLIYFRIDTVLLSLFKDQHEVGIYNLSYKLLEQLIFFPALFVGILTPVLSGAFAVNRERFMHIFSKSVGIIAVFAFPVFVGGFFLASPLVLFLGGEAFLAASGPLRILLAATTLIFFGTILGTVAIVAGRQRAALPVYGVAMAVNLLGNLIVIPKYSYMGAAWMTVITEVIVDLGLIAVLARVGISTSIPALKKIAIALLVMAIPLIALQASIATLGVWSLAIFVPMCTVLYGLALLALRVVSRNDLRLLRNPQLTTNNE